MNVKDENGKRVFGSMQIGWQCRSCKARDLEEGVFSGICPHKQFLRGGWQSAEAQNMLKYIMDDAHRMRELCGMLPPQAITCAFPEEDISFLENRETRPVESLGEYSYKTFITMDPSGSGNSKFAFVSGVVTDDLKFVILGLTSLRNTCLTDLDKRQIQIINRHLDSLVDILGRQCSKSTLHVVIEVNYNNTIGSRIKDAIEDWRDRRAETSPVFPRVTTQNTPLGKRGDIVGVLTGDKEMDKPGLHVATKLILQRRNVIFADRLAHNPEEDVADLKREFIRQLRDYEIKPEKRSKDEMVEIIYDSFDPWRRKMRYSGKDHGPDDLCMAFQLAIFNAFR